MKRPEWATAKVRLHLATCWYGVEEQDEFGNEGCTLEGVHFWDDWLLSFSTFFHFIAVAPFNDSGFPIKFLEVYDE